MATIRPPRYVRQVLVGLQGRDWPTFLVGGCVRDMLLGVQPHDWDICTAARPEQIMEVFPGSKLTGGRTGTVTVRLNSHSVEVTPFRSEGDYSDHRHPDLVRFVTDLTADLSRRDFTVNAMALSPDGLLSDPFGGAADLRRGVIRCVGEPERRFEEDALRMLRALRFSAKLGFTIDLFTREAIREKAPLCATLPPERIQGELEKILLSPAPDTVFEVVELGLLDSYLYHRLPAAIGERVSALPRHALERWAGFAWLLEHYGCVSSAAGFLQALRLDTRTIYIVGGAAERMAQPMPQTPLEWKRCLRRCGVEVSLCAARLADAFLAPGHTRAAKAVLNGGECWSLRQLRLGGDELLALGLQGKEIGAALEKLLDDVIEHPEHNERQQLLRMVREMEGLDG